MSHRDHPPLKSNSDSKKRPSDVFDKTPREVAEDVARARGADAELDAMRDRMFPIIKDAAECQRNPHMRNACDGGACMCAQIAWSVADELTR